MSRPETTDTALYKCTRCGSLAEVSHPPSVCEECGEEITEPHVQY